MTPDQETLRAHLKHASDVLESVLDQHEGLRQELYAALKRAEAAEQSRDTIRVHAQASLDKYRAQDVLLERLKKIASDELTEYSRMNEAFRAGFNSALSTIRGVLKDLKEEANSHENPPPGYAPCTRASGHDGPCALPFK